jgi:N-acetylglucosaminyl-diphospho-decaprenol L-rhamnosyltransferase
MATDVAVVVVTYNSAHVVAELLDSLPAALGALTADISVVDNGSTDGTRDLIEMRDDCRLIRSSNIGYAGGINIGIRSSRPADAIMVLNPDTRMHPGSIATLFATLQLPRTGLVAPRVVEADGTVQTSLRREPTLLRALGLTGTRMAIFSEYLARPEDYRHPQVVDWALGAALLVSSECSERVGEWDESFFLYSEETDFCLRARDLGLLTRYEPDATCEHIGGQSGQNDRTHAMQIVNRVRLYARRRNDFASWTYYALTILSEATWVARGHRQSRAAIMALLSPSHRPAELGCSGSLLPR